MIILGGTEIPLTFSRHEISFCYFWQIIESKQRSLLKELLQWKFLKSMGSFMMIFFCFLGFYNSELFMLFLKYSETSLIWPSKFKLEWTSKWEVKSKRHWIIDKNLKWNLSRSSTSFNYFLLIRNFSRCWR